MTLFTSDTNKKRYTLFYLGMTLFIGLFSFIYEHFSFGVISYYMVFAFLIPLHFGFVISFFIEKLDITPNRLWNDGVLIMTLWMVLKGVLEIYGTTSLYTKYFFIIGLVLLVIGIIPILYQIHIKTS